MPGKRISELTALSGAASANNDDLLIFDSGAGETKRISRSQLAEGMVPDLPLQYYLGVLNANPTQRLSGDALQIGDFYLDAVTKYTTVYNGSGWNSYASVIAAQSAAETARDEARDWAGSPTPPGGAGTESAKTAAEKARADAQQTAADRVQTGLDKSSAENAKFEAEAARDAAFVNADVYADTAAGLATTTEGDQFQVVSGGVIIRYRHDAGPAATEVARYPTAGQVSTLTGIGGTASAIVATADVTPGVGKKYVLTPLHDSTGATTLSINGGAAMTIRDSENAAVGRGDLKAGVPIILLQTGSVGVRILGPSLAAVAGAGGIIPDETDLNTLIEPRTYYGLAGNAYPKLPADLVDTEGKATQAFHLRVSIPGAGLDNARVRVMQEVFGVSSPTNVYKRYFNSSSPPSSGVWGLVGASSSYRGNPVGGDLDMLMQDGEYVLTGGWTNGPSDWPVGITSALMWVIPMGANFAIQQMRTASDDGAFWQRVIRPSTGVVQAWNRFSAADLTGRRVVFLGDSQVENGTWPQLIADKTGCISIKGGFGGTRLTEMSNSLDGMCGVDVADAIASGDWTDMEAAAEARFLDNSDDNRPIVAALKAVDWAQVDFIVAHWGTNDWNNGVPLGDADLTEDRTTIRGAVNYVMQRILTAHPHITVLWVSPPFRARQVLGDGLDSDTYPNSDGVFLRELGDAMRDQAQQLWNAPAFDMYRNSGITRANYSHFLRAQTVDGLHYFGPGQNRAADRIAGALRRLV